MSKSPRRGEHLALSAAREFLPEKIHRWTGVFAAAVAAAVAGLLTYAGVVFVQAESQSILKLAIGLPVWVVELVIPIGYAIVLNVLDESHLLDIGVVPAAQGQGLGRYFLGWLCERAKEHGADTFFLEVRPSNVAALRLYERFGFAEIGRRRGYYPAAEGREDAIVMRLAL